MIRLTYQRLPRHASPRIKLSITNLMLVGVTLLVWSTAELGLSQEPQNSLSISKVSQFNSPQEVARSWMRAVNRGNWRDEYGCYAGPQQARFTYHIALSVREFSDAKDLSEQCNLILDNSNFPLSILDDFPSLRTDLSSITDPDEQKRQIETLQFRREEQLARWEKEIQPLSVDWPGMIESLQPLFIESLRRHSYDSHPSATGIAHHLGYYRFELPSITRIQDKEAEGTVVAKSMTSYDPDLHIADDSLASSKLKPITFIDEAKAFIRAFRLHNEVVKRDPQNITFQKIESTWCINSVPYR